MLENQDFKDFSISTWYDQFKHLCLKTIIIDIPEDLVKKIQQGDSDINVKEICSEEYLIDLRNAINALGESVFVKNNWHSPQDAKMFSFGNSLKVTNVKDLMLYLSISNIIQDDFINCKSVPLCFAFKKYISIHPAAEFRCIVINSILRGITPRDWPTYYGHFKEEGPRIIDAITNFYNENIKLNFPRQNYTFDIVFSFPDDPYILDFGPLNNKTNLYAFTWNEISPLINKDVPEEIAPVFRYLESDIGIMTKSDALSKIAQSNN